MKQVVVLAAGSEDGEHDLAAEAKAVAEKLTTLEAALVDVHREPDRDVLRNPAGLNDTLLGLISTVSLSDSAPTNQAAAVSREIMARVDAEIGKLERLAATEVGRDRRFESAFLQRGVWCEPVIEVISVAPIERASDHIDLLSPACRSAPSMRPRVRSSPPSTNAWLVIGGLIAVSMLALPLLRPPAAQVDMTRHRKAA